MNSPVETTPPIEVRYPVSIALGAALFFLGVLIGTLVAMSATSLVQTVITALFALIGGSLIGFLQKLSAENQFKAALGVLGISLGALVGVYSGVYVTQYQLLTPISRRFHDAPTINVSSPYVYLRASDLTEVAVVEEKYRNNFIGPEDAYAQLYALAKNLPGADAIDQQYRSKPITPDTTKEAYEKLHALAEKASGQ